MPEEDALVPKFLRKPRPQVRGVSKSGFSEVDVRPQPARVVGTPQVEARLPRDAGGQLTDKPTVRTACIRVPIESVAPEIALRESV